ncbi:MAG: TIGR04283 family arsenosugar biosynthesis glycosyltransferase [Bryobacteraceae bacterium]
MRKMQLAIVIPTLNEAEVIGGTLDAVLKLEGDCEVVIADGGSDDATVDIVQARGANVIETARGRGVQMHAGARATRGDVLWFLHADTCPPPDAAARIFEALEAPDTAGGNFSLCFDGPSREANLLTRAYPHFRKLGLCYGDSGIFCRRSVYERVGGFQPYPIFEDLDLIKRLKRQGRFVHLPCQITTSSRRFEDHSFTRTFAHWTAMQILYWMGVSPNLLGRAYAPIRGRKT